MGLTQTSADIPAPESAAVAEAELICLAARGDRKASRELLLHLLPRVRRTVAWLSRNGGEQDDLVQMALMQILFSIGSFRGESSLACWADRVTVQTAARVFEKRDRRRRLSDATHVAPPEPPAVDGEVDTARLKDRLKQHLLELPEKQQVPVVLHHLHGYSVEEIADLTGARLNTVRGRLRNGLKALRSAALADPGICEYIRGRNR